MREEVVELCQRSDSKSSLFFAFCFNLTNIVEINSQLISPNPRRQVDTCLSAFISRFSLFLKAKAN